MAFIRKVKNSSGATAVQIAYKVGGRIVKIIHIGSAHNKPVALLLLSPQQAVGVLRKSNSISHLNAWNRRC